MTAPGPASSVRKDLDVGVLSHVGMVRSENQDSFRYFEPAGDEEFRRKGRLLVVCDGMGGHNGGTVASRTTVDAVVEAFEHSAVLDLRRLLTAAIERANQRVRELGARDPALRNMGTTCVALGLRGEEVRIAHIGDSRAYLVRDGHIEQLTRDHTYLNDLIEIGLLTPEKARHHPERNIITRCVGMGDALQVDYLSHRARSRDVFVLCSDGLYNHVEPEEILEIVRELPCQEACQRLVDLANLRGGEDNITVGIMRVEEIPEGFVTDPAEAAAGAAAAATTPVISLTGTPPAPRPGLAAAGPAGAESGADPEAARRRRWAWMVLLALQVLLLIVLYFVKNRY
jgi:serine/threonine protein phosphatase PrpC